MVVFSLLSLVILSYGCEQTQNTKEPRSIQLSSIGSDTFKFDVTFQQPTFFFKTFDIRNREYIGVVNLKYGNSLYIRPLTGDTSGSTTINFSDFGVGKIRTFDVYDSLVYVFVRNSLAPDSCLIHTFDIKGKYLGKLDYRRSPAFKDKGDPADRVEIFAGQNSPIQVDSGRVLVSVIDGLILNDRSIVGGYISLDDTNFIPLPIRIPPSYFNVPQESNRQYFLSNLLVVGHRFYGGFPASGDLYYWDIGGSEVKHVVAESKYLPKLKLPPTNNPPDGSQIPTSVDEEVQNNGMYGRLFYLEKLDVIVRMAYHPYKNLEESNSSEGSKLENLRPGSLIFLDRDLNLKGESAAIPGVIDGGISGLRDGTIYLQDNLAMGKLDSSSHAIILKKWRVTNLTN